MIQISFIGEQPGFKMGRNIVPLKKKKRTIVSPGELLSQNE
jgi:hypothetical protein